MLGGILSEQGSPECISLFEKSIKINPRSYLAFRGLGNYFLKTQSFVKAEENYSMAIKINPNRFGPIYKNRGIVRMNQNKNKEAKEDFESYLKYSPNAPDKQNILQALKEL